MSNKMKSYVGAGLLALVAAMPALATVTGTAIAGDAFNSFAATIVEWLAGGLGVGIAVAALIVGGATAAATGKPLVMAGAVVVAMMFAFGPRVLVDLVSAGDPMIAMIPGLTS